MKPTGWGRRKDNDQPYPKFPRKPKLSTVVGSVKPSSGKVHLAHKEKHVKIPQQDSPIKVVSNFSDNLSFEEIIDSDSESIYKIKNVTAKPNGIESEYYVKTTNMKEAIGDEWTEHNGDNDWTGNLILLPKINYINTQKIYDAFSSQGIEDEDEIHGYIKNRPNAVASALIEYGFGIPIGEHEIGNDESELRKKVAQQAEGSAVMIGFFMDSRVNRMGTTGWDLLQELTHGGSAFERTLRKQRREQANRNLGRE